MGVKMSIGWELFETRMSSISIQVCEKNEELSLVAPITSLGSFPILLNKINKIEEWLRQFSMLNNRRSLLMKKINWLTGISNFIDLLAE